MGLEKVADGVWLLRGDFRGAMNIYFLEDGDGVVQFDAGTKGMRKKARAAGEQLGGVKRVVLGHAHADHRAPLLIWGRRSSAIPTKPPAPNATPRSPPTSISRGCRWPVRWLYPPLFGAGTAAP